MASVIGVKSAAGGAPYRFLVPSRRGRFVFRGTSWRHRPHIHDTTAGHDTTKHTPITHTRRRANAGKNDYFYGEFLRYISNALLLLYTHIHVVRAFYIGRLLSVPGGFDSIRFTLLLSAVHRWCVSFPQPVCTCTEQYGRRRQIGGPVEAAHRYCVCARAARGIPHTRQGYRVATGPGACVVGVSLLYDCCYFRNEKIANNKWVLTSVSRTIQNRPTLGSMVKRAISMLFSAKHSRPPAFSHRRNRFVRL